MAASISVIVAIRISRLCEDRKDRATTEEIARAEADLRELGAEIAAIKDADLTSMNDFIAAHAQIEPLEKAMT
jgi:hypothetical protein